ncbi:MAG TPA: phosphoenolpyruvate-utilizing N-terminal domain-containing protein, partial [Rhizobiaceae bacterium]|nr:phosphoenolpyruvate-utilizing N-terminal domain-containing protein [Rhizobiaceae bacterium]
MPAPLRLSGQTASAGYARGPLWLAPSRTETHYRGSGDVNRESSALANALEKASAATAELIASAEGDAADILEFQLAMIEDDTFRVSANGRIAGGEDAATAWTAVLDAEIAGYEASDDAYFAARAADLADIRDRVLSMLTGEKAGVIPAGVIYVGDDITPSVFLAHDWTGGGFALRHGSATGHVAMLARQRGVPALVAIGDAPLEAGVDSLLDASTGSLTASPAPQDIAEFEAGRQSSVERAAFAAQYAARPARTADGAPIDVLVNIAEPSDTASIPIAHCDGVGLMRTEFLYAHGLPDEDTQYAAY